MKYSDLIRKIKTTAGARDDESEDALEVVVENVASHLTDSTRRQFAAKLPSELQTAAQMVPTITHIDEDIIDQLLDIDDMDESRARRNLRAAWRALTELFDSESVRDITEELPQDMRAVLN